MKVNYESQFRATFNDTKNNQQKFRHILDKLITEKRPLNESERDTVINLYNDSNLGLGCFNTVLWLSNGKKIEIPHLEKFVRDLFDYDKKIVDGDFFFFSLGRYKELTVDIDELWKQIKSKTHQVEAEALTQSLRISREQPKKEKAIGADLSRV